MKQKSSIKDIMENSIHLINENYNQPLHLNTLARQNFLSPATYSRYFFEFTQCSFSDYINQLRVEHAKNDLIYTTLSLTDIALDNGFSNSSVFSKTFRHYVQMSPSDYRKKYKCPDAPAKSEAKTVALEISRQSAYPYHKQCLSAINAGEAKLLVRADFQQQLLQLKKELSFQYVRIWDIFSADIFPCGYTELTRLNFIHLDNIFDFLVSHQLKPWLNLTKSSDVLLFDISYVYTEPNMGFPLQSHEFVAFCEKLFRHWITRYGADTVSDWIFECWFDDMNLNTEYIRSFIDSFAAIKALLSRLAPKAKLGAIGNALPGMQSAINTLLQHWPSNIQPDFISIFSFPYKNQENNLPEKLQKNNFTQKCIQMMQEMLSAYKMEHIPIYITQWNITVSPRNAINDSCAVACILLSSIEETLDYPWPIIYCQASDFSTLHQDTLPLIFGGTGIMTRNALCKPSFYALQFFKKLPGYVLAHGPGYIIATDKAGRIDLLLFNTCPLPDIYYQKKEYEITTGFVTYELTSGNTLPFSINIRTEHTSYRQRTQRLTPGDTDLIGHLLHFGDYSNPSAEDIEYLRHTACPKLTGQYITVENHHISLLQQLKPYEICYISLCPEE